MPPSSPEWGMGVRDRLHPPRQVVTSAPDHPAGLRAGISYPAWAPAGAGTFGAFATTQALERGGATEEGIAEDPPPIMLVLCFHYLRCITKKGSFNVGR